MFFGFALSLGTACAMSAGDSGKPKQTRWDAPPAMALQPDTRYVAVIKTTHGDMRADLYANDAPNTVNNFVFLARQGFFDGVKFHRIIRGFMVQTGDPEGTGRGGPGYRFGDELSSPHTYQPGTLAMANAGPNTQGSQFFICHADLTSRLPKNYTIFGKVTEGLDVVDKIASVPVSRSETGEASAPQVDVRMQSVTIEERR